MSENQNLLVETNIRCYLCHCSNDLVMLAHRVDGFMVGWLFVCQQDFENIKTKTLKIELVEHEKSTKRIDQRTRVREVMVEAMKNIDRFDGSSFKEIAMHIQNHLTDKGFKVVESD